MILYMHIPCFHLLQDDNLLLYGTIRWFFILLHQVTPEDHDNGATRRTPLSGCASELLWPASLRTCCGQQWQHHVKRKKYSHGQNQDHETNIIKSSSSSSTTTSSSSSSSSSKSRSKTSCFSNPGTHLWLFLQSEPRPLASWTPLTSEMPALAMSGR